ncbi:hypothetical protein BDQ17DRAFT_1270552 [Cyathus striatus]|nr:hypothetical protein BDQ17DRAFT_1270552 [Cyathus striatus]
MYLHPPAASSSMSFGTGVSELVHRVVVHLIHVVSVLDDLIEDAGHRFAGWSVHVALALGHYFYLVFQHPSEWAVVAFYAFINFLHVHPHIVHILCWTIFFGPIVVLLPFLVLHELVFSIVFNLSFVSHGLIRGALEDQYTALKESFLDRREPFFALVEEAAARYNQLTTLCLPLVVVRLAAAALAMYVTYGIWFGW